MKRKATRRILSIIMVLAMIVPMCVMSASAITIPCQGWVSYYYSIYKTNIKGYANTSDRIYVYDDYTCRVRNGGYIDGKTDEVVITQFCTTTNTVKVKYPIYGGGYKEKWVSAKYFFNNTNINSASVYRANCMISTYKRYYTNEDYGYIDRDDFVYYMGSDSKGSKIRVIYPLSSGGYKMAWISSYNFAKKFQKIG